MKLFSTIILTLLILLPSLGSGVDWCCELSKVDNLVAHFKKHNHEEGISFIQFLDKHYGTSENNDGDNHEDLPFHGGHNCKHSNLVMEVPEITYELIRITEITELRTFYTLRYSSDISFSIFQPPRKV